MKSDDRSRPDHPIPGSPTTDFLFRWFVGLGMEDPVWDATSFTKNRDRLLEGEVAVQFLAAVR